jgi:hypothetical protein
MASRALAYALVLAAVLELGAIANARHAPPLSQRDGIWR